MADQTIPVEEARRIVLAAQGFGFEHSNGVGAEDLAAVICRMGVLQLDFVNVLIPAHYLVLYSRVGSYDRHLFEETVYRNGMFIEQWAHEASIVPVDLWPLLRERREAFGTRPASVSAFIAEHAEYVAGLLELVRRHGPVTADDLPGPDGRSNRLRDSWVGTFTRAVLETFFGRGVLCVSNRKPNFQRVYNLSERIVNEPHYSNRFTVEESRSELIRRAARACGIGTATDLADYYRMPIRQAREVIQTLVARGELIENRVEGWRETAYTLGPVPTSNPITGAIILSPFDPIVWFRPRAERLFHFDYRIEIYVPREKRKWGYYVLPFLLDERIVGRLDVKAFRREKILQVASAHIEAGISAEHVAEALCAELVKLAAWLGLETVRIEPEGSLSRYLPHVLTVETSDR